MHRIPLATFAWQRTEPRFELHPETINLFLPSRMGDLPWLLPRHDVAVVDTRDQAGQALPGGIRAEYTEADFAHLAVPYLATSTAAAPPTTGLLFRETRTHPVLGRLDGFVVREEIPGQLIDLAAALGLDTATDLTWFADHRRAMPPGTASVRSTLRRVENVGVVSAAAGGGLFFLAAGQNMHQRTGRVGLLMLLGGAGLAVASDWLERHRLSDGTGDSADRTGDRLESSGFHIGSN